MRNAFEKLVLRVVLAWIMAVCAGPVIAEKPFVHPGALNTTRNLDFVKTQLAAGRSPWSEAFRDVESAAGPAPTPIHQVNSLDQNDVEASKRSAINAYANALAWQLTGKAVYGRQALQTLNGWSGFTGFTGGSDQDKLQAGWVGALLGDAADIMRSHPDWTPKEVAALQAMFRRAFYPQLDVASRWNGNVDLTQIDALMTLAVFNDDRVAFELALKRLELRSAAYIYLKSDGAVPAVDGDNGDVDAFWFHPAQWVDGLTQETCRDNGHHAQFGLGSALHAAEIAWNQGIDVYGRQSRRYTSAMELMARQLLSGDMQGTCSDPAATRGVLDTFEIGYNNYHTRMGVPMPFTERLIAERVRPQGTSEWNIFHETLTHAGASQPSPP